jgi:hypothetical protein
MVVLGLVLAVGRVMYLNAVPPDVLSQPAAATVFDTFVRFLRTGLRATAVLGLLVAIAAFVTGPAPAAVRTRGFLEHGVGSLRGGAEAAGLKTGPVGAWTYTHKRGLRVGILIAAGLVLVFWTRPTAGVVLLTALLCLLALGVIEFLARPPTPGTAETTGLQLAHRGPPSGGRPAAQG